MAKVSAPLPHPFNELLRGAFDAVEAVDMFDVHSGDEQSLREWQRLLAKSNTAEQALIDHILSLAKEE